MTKIMNTLVAFVLLFAASIAVACDYPAPPKDLPDGAIATRDEMLAGVQKISAFQKAMTNYLACIEAEQVVDLQTFAEDDDESKNISRAKFNKKYNAAVEVQTRTVEMFNLEIRAYKAR